MSERSAEQIRTETAAERQRLDDDLDAFEAEVRSLVPFLVAGLLALALLVVALLTGLRKLRRPHS